MQKLMIWGKFALTLIFVCLFGIFKISSLKALHFGAIIFFCKICHKLTTSNKFGLFLAAHF